MANSPLLARGPWDPSQVVTRWRDDEYEPDAASSAAADAAVDELRRRGSPSHDGLAARLANWEATPDALELELQPSRWSLRLTPMPENHSLSVLCIVRSAEGRWLAGRRADWVATWAGRWALGAGGAVEIGESPATTLSRELEEEWSVQPERMTIEALVHLQSDLLLLVGLAHLPAGADEQVVPDDEHDEFAWWPADVSQWPDEADEPLRLMARMLS
jgi:ADP-ribose pyrophosphatase YjhB (NUDIX family)